MKAMTRILALHRILETKTIQGGWLRRSLGKRIRKWVKILHLSRVGAVRDYCTTHWRILLLEGPLVVGKATRDGRHS
jgi:hypothetical protein